MFLEGGVLVRMEDRCPQRVVCWSGWGLGVPRGWSTGQGVGWMSPEGGLLVLQPEITAAKHWRHKHQCNTRRAAKAPLGLLLLFV